MKWPKIRIREKFKGFFASGGKPPKKEKFWIGEKTWQARCKHYDLIFERHPLAKAQILTIAGQLMAEGVFTESAVNRQGDEYTRAKEAQERCDRLNENIGLDTILYDTAVYMAKYGSCFWEKSKEPIFDVRIIPSQELIEPATRDDIGNITSWRQASLSKPQPQWSSDEIVHFAWNVTAKSWPYGTSLLVGLDTEFEVLEQLEEDIKEFMHHSAFPYELWQVGDEAFRPTESQLETIKTTVKNWEPGEHHVTDYHIDLKTGGTGDKTITNLNDILNFLKDQCIDGLMVPPISKQWSSTMASATEMLPWARANLIQPMQRIIRRKIEHEVYQPYLESLGFSVRVCPKLKWESPDAHKDEEAEYWALQVQSGIVPAEYAAEQQGFDVEKIKKLKEEALRRQAEQMQYQKTFPIEPKQSVKQKTQQEEEK